MPVVGEPETLGAQPNRPIPVCPSLSAVSPRPSTDASASCRWSGTAALSSGECAVDACVPREDIAAELRNEDRTLVRVYVDEDRNLQRLPDDTFVRNVVLDGPDDEAVIHAQLADSPPDATDDDLMLSALLHGAISPSFVRSTTRTTKTSCRACSNWMSIRTN